MKFTEFLHKHSKTNNLPVYILSGSEYFLKKQALTGIKETVFLEGGVKDGLIEFNGKDTGSNFTVNTTEGSATQNVKSFCFIKRYF